MWVTTETPGYVKSEKGGLGSRSDSLLRLHSRCDAPLERGQDRQAGWLVDQPVGPGCFLERSGHDPLAFPPRLRSNVR